MSQLRFDLTTADWVVFAPLRKLRPHREQTAPRPAADDLTKAGGICPFCPGNERLTPPEIYAIRKDSTAESDWQVRVVANKFPALTIEEDVHRRDGGPMFQFMGGCGAHEVIVESPQHSCFLAQQPTEQVELLLQTLVARYRDLKRDHRFQSIVIFKNHGLGAGTSLAHPHWQIIATPVVPRLLRLKCITATEYFDRTGSCLYTDILDKEIDAKTRIVTMNDEFVSLIPFAAHLPFETWIVPRRPQATLDSFDPLQLRPLADMLKTVLLKLYVGLDNPDFNLTVDMAPCGDEQNEYFHWHIRILPRLTTPAGFEMGSGMSINTVLPEEAAAFLRNGYSG